MPKYSVELENARKSTIIGVSKIKVASDRYREDFDEKKFDGLVESIREHGILNPLIVDDQMNLIAGERRLRAAKQVGLTLVPAREFSSLNDHEKRVIELEENLHRQDLSWAEETAATKALDELFRKMNKKSPQNKKRDGNWSERDTAAELGRGFRQTIQDIRTAEMVEAMPELAKQKTKAAAVRTFLRAREREIIAELTRRQALENNLDDRWALLQGAAYDHIKKMKDESVDYVFADPPFGIDIDKCDMSSDSNKGWRKLDSYSDDVKSIMAMYAKTIPELARVLKKGHHMVFWFAIQFYDNVHDMLAKAGLCVDHIPVIWDKCRHTHPFQGRRLCNQYMSAFYCSKGKIADRVRLKGQATNVVRINVTDPDKIGHVAEMPVQLPLHYYSLVLHPDEVVLDAFAGSGAAMEAAVVYGCKVIGIELKESNCGLIHERMQRRAKYEQEQRDAGRELIRDRHENSDVSKL